MATDTRDFATEMFNQAADSFRKTLDAGLKVQEQVSKMFNPAMGVQSAFEDMRRKGERFSQDYVAMVEKAVQQGQRTMDEQSKTSLDMLRKAFDAAKGQTPADMQARTTELWQTSLDSVKSCTETMMKTNAQMVENWSALMGTACNGHDAKMAPAARKA